MKVVHKSNVSAIAILNFSVSHAAVPANSKDSTVLSGHILA